MFSTHKLQELMNNHKKLKFIHTPKCGGSYVSSILSNLKIPSKGHTQATKNENATTFTVIRDPVDRFESLLNYRLNEKMIRNDWPARLRYVYKNKNITLNNIVSKMTNSEILGFNPFNTLSYWTKNVNIIITIDNLQKTLNYFNYNYDINQFEKKNVSVKTRGKFNMKTINRIKRLYKNDMILYNKILNSSFNL